MRDEHTTLLQEDVGIVLFEHSLNRAPRVKNILKASFSLEG